MNKKAWIVAGVILFLMVVAIVNLGPTHSENDTVRVGALLALTGSGANYGRSLRNGIELAKEEINSQGGIGGKRLEIVYEDSQGDAKTGVSAFTKLVDVDRVPLVIGSISSVILAVAPVADQRHVVLVNSSAISPKIPEQATNFLFSIMVSGAQEAEFFAGWYAKAHLSEPVAIIYSNNSSGIDTKDTLVRELTKAGGRIAATEGYELSTTDFRTHLTKIRESQAKHAYMIAFSSDEFARILNQAQELDLRMRWYTYSGFETRETLALSSSAAQGIVYSYPDYTAQQDRMDSFYRTYEAKFSSWPDIYTATSYDGINLLAQIMRQHGTSSLQIQGGLRQADAYLGVFGVLKFENRQYVKKPLLWKTVRDGRFVLLGNTPEVME
jgi:branched-chain amino acid transport system substrate-binding protein